MEAKLWLPLKMNLFVCLFLHSHKFSHTNRTMRALVVCITVASVSVHIFYVFICLNNQTIFHAGTIIGSYDNILTQIYIDQLIPNPKMILLCQLNHPYRFIILSMVQFRIQNYSPNEIANNNRFYVCVN